MNKILVAMSGGVDSSSAAWLLLSQGRQVSGATMKLLADGDDADAADALSVCRKLGVTHYTFDFTDVFKRIIINEFINSYLSGETPNPCVGCNRNLKFGKFIECAGELGFGHIATGHYARIEYDDVSGRYLLKKAKDLTKEQSYVLYSLTQSQLSKALLPLGGYTKSEVRAIAAENGFENSQKPDSQDICFVREGDYRDFIARYTDVFGRVGNFIDTCGNVIGRHKGIENYTIGQRKGIGIAYSKPLYVCKKDFASNIITLGGEQELNTKTFTVRDINLIAVKRLGAPVRAMVRIRYNGAESPAVVNQISDSEAIIEFDKPQRAITPGQAAVFYDGEIVIGAGTIC